ncbi:hypothetical protein MHU86_5985 [Fragilaria crotonensis]|nr:hypothetical protein MHU86_5985 [Fragilaria crotonensis]
MILKEEGDTSHLNQAYDQSVAKNDKAGMRMNLDLIRPHIGVRLDQWYLISIAIEALKKIKASAWIESFKKVNLHPRHRVSFDVWLKKIDTKLSSGEFFASRTSLFDAMPAVWKNINTSLGDVGKLRCCYLAAKRDPSVFVIDDNTNSRRCPPNNTPAAGANLCSLRSSSSCNINQIDNVRVQEASQSHIDTLCCSWRPAAVVEKYNEAPTDKKNQLMFFHHITNFVATKESQNSRNLVPAEYLNVEINADQVELLKPTQKNVMMGSILKDAAGKGARQLIAKRRIDMIDGNREL